MPSRLIGFHAAAVLAVPLALGLALPAGAQRADAGAPVLAPHRAVYEFALGTTRSGNSLASLSGRMVYEFTGSSCDGFTQTKFNIFEHAIDEVRREPRWQAARDASIHLCEKCRQCQFMNACGGGYLPHRFSTSNGYDNPSGYCDDLYAMFENMQSVLADHLYVEKPGGNRIAFRDALTQA